MTDIYTQFLTNYNVGKIYDYFSDLVNTPDIGRSFSAHASGIPVDVVSPSYDSAILFGRDIFGRISQCIKFKENRLYIRRMPGRVDQRWIPVPQGTFIIIRGNGIVKETDRYALDENDAKYCFNDIKNCVCDVFEYCSTEAGTWFRENDPFSFVKKLQVRLLSSGSLLRVSRTVENPSFVSKPYEEQFITVFERALVDRYMKISKKKRYFFLFSGGVDSFFVTFMVARKASAGSELVLFNVAFKSDGKQDDEKDMSPERNSSGRRIPSRPSKDYEETDDRKASVAAYVWLVETFPDHKFTFVRIDVSKEELKAERRRVIALAIAPNDTVLDDAIGCCLWFATRAKGYILDKDENTKHEVVYRDAKYILVGSGSDELLCGYHRVNRFGNYNAIVDGIERDIKNIGNKNFDRDDRVAFSNKRTLLVPFMDETVVDFCNRLPISQKFVFNKSPGIGEKIILRKAMQYSGIAAKFYQRAKKAFQFGSNIAKIEQRKEKAHMMCSRLLVDNVDEDSSDDIEVNA